MNLQEQTVLVTGAASGFGNFLAIALSKICKQVVSIDISDAQFEEKNIVHYQCDLTKIEQVTEIIKEIYSKYRVSVLINNAGKIHSEPLINLMSREDKRHSIANWDQMLQVNLSSVFYTSVNVAEQMMSKRIKGLIINVSSISAAGNPGQSVYAAAKAGVNALTSTWGQELAMFGIRTAGIAPGFFDTGSTHEALSKGVLDKVKKEIPLRRFGKPEELLSGVKYIIMNDFYNARVLEVDGGLKM